MHTPSHNLFQLHPPSRSPFQLHPPSHNLFQLHPPSRSPFHAHMLSAHSFCILSAQHIPVPHMASHHRIQPSLIACLFMTTHPNLHISVCVHFSHNISCMHACMLFHHIRPSLFTHSFSSVHPHCMHTLIIMVGFMWCYSPISTAAASELPRVQG